MYKIWGRLQNRLNKPQAINEWRHNPRSRRGRLRTVRAAQYTRIDSWSVDSMSSWSKSQQVIFGYRQTDSKVYMGRPKTQNIPHNTKQAERHRQACRSWLPVWKYSDQDGVTDLSTDGQTNGQNKEPRDRTP